MQITLTLLSIDACRSTIDSPTCLGLLKDWKEPSGRGSIAQPVLIYVHAEFVINNFIMELNSVLSIMTR